MFTDVGYDTWGSEAELSSSPHSPLGVESDGVARSHTHPLRNGAVLTLFLGQHALYLERLMSRHLQFCLITPRGRKLLRMRNNFMPDYNTSKIESYIHFTH